MTSLTVICRDLVVYEGPDETLPATHIENLVIQLEQQTRDISLWIQDIAAQVDTKTARFDKEDPTCSFVLSLIKTVEREIADTARALNAKAQASRDQDQGPEPDFGASQASEPIGGEELEEKDPLEKECDKVLKSIRQKCHPDKKPGKHLVELYDLADRAAKNPNIEERLQTLLQILQAVSSRSVRRALKTRKSLKAAKRKLDEARQRLSQKYKERFEFKQTLGWYIHESNDVDAAAAYADYLKVLLNQKQQELAHVKSRLQGQDNGNQKQGSDNASDHQEHTTRA